jgi:DNA-binding LacI/PurR family transcriptional regulator
MTHHSSVLRFPKGLKDKRVRPIVYDSKGISFFDGLAIGRELFSKSKRPTAIQCIPLIDSASGSNSLRSWADAIRPATMSRYSTNFGLATRLYLALSTATLPLMSMAVAATRQVRETLEGRPVTASQQFKCEVVLRESIGRAVSN